jgi:ammonia channel protein AmtB
LFSLNHDTWFSAILWRSSQEEKCFIYVCFMFWIYDYRKYCMDVYRVSMAFGADISGVIGDPFQYFGLSGIINADAVGTLPLTVFVGFQCMFLLITAAILASPFAERAKFSSFAVFIAIWSILVYSPIAHWVWGGGWLQQMGALDFAGGTVVHVNVGCSAFAVALVIGKRIDYQKYPQKPIIFLWYCWDLDFCGLDGSDLMEEVRLVQINGRV